jgi:hypothetical protein
MKILNTFLRLPAGPVSAAFERSWVNLYKFILGLLGLPVGYIETVSIFFGRITPLHFHRGKVGLVLYLKESQRCLLKFLVGQPVKATSVKLIDGLPAILPGVIRKGIKAGDIAAIRIALTLLGFVRVIFHKGAIRFHNITDPTKWTPSVSKRNRMLKDVLKALKWLKVSPYRIPSTPPVGPKSNRSGPNGHATLAAHWDALALRESELWVVFKDLSKALGLSHLIPTVESLSLITGNWVARYPFLTRQLPAHFASLGKLGVKDEAGGKKRVFAISDYWTQAVCKPLHDYLMKVLKKLPMDGTWDQGNAADQVAKWTAENRPLYAFDLSAATDRFPGGFIVLVLTSLIGAVAASLWLTLLTKRDYWYKGSAYRYNAGQPMGTLSSWASFALAHHVVVQIAAMRAGWTGLFSDYRLLGDDIVIADADVAEEYQELMASFHVDINDSKSLCGIGTSEFAKRHFHRGHEVTGLTGSLILLAGTRLSGLRVLIDVALRRGWEVSAKSFVCSVALFAPSMEAMRVWRSILVSVLGPGGPLTVAQALWGGLPDSSTASLMGTLLAPGKFIPATTASAQLDCGLIGPQPESESLVLEIYRHFELRRLRKAREAHGRWMETLLGSLGSLLGGWILNSSDKALDGSAPQICDDDRKVARALLEAGHPAGTLSPMTEPLETEHSEWELMDLSIPLSKGDRLAPAVWGLAPSGDLALLQAASKDTEWAWQVIRSIRATLPLAFEWQEPGALEMIREGLTLEIGEILTQDH